VAFLDDNYLLTSDAAAGLFSQVRELPFVDPHNHADVKEIWQNANWADIWQVEAATDHYVWELLRKRGVGERLITGDAPNRDKWLALAEVFDDFVGNPTYEWIHLDLKRRLGVDQLISADTGPAIWDATAAVLQKPEMRPQELLRQMNVACICSTDDPVDTLEYHRKLADEGSDVGVRPTFRPDKAMNIFKPEWRDYIKTLGERFGPRIDSVDDLLEALRQAHDFFAENGCVASDHGVEVPYAYEVQQADAETIFKKAMQGKALDEDDIIGYMSFMLNEMAELDADRGWVFQLHLGCVRDMRRHLAENVGPDTGGDISDHLIDIIAPLTPLLNRFDGRLKIVLYTLDPSHWPTVATLSRAFGQTVSLGAAWWMNDSPIGMRRQLEYIGSVDLLANFSGMVSDSRKLVSYGSRNEMFRRVLCDVVGRMVEMGQVPLPLAERLVVHLSYERPKELFGL